MSQVSQNPQERFVSGNEAAEHLGITRRFLLSLARKGQKGCYPIGTGEFRKRWVFKLSELDEGIDPKLAYLDRGGRGGTGGGRPPQAVSRYDLSIRRSSLK